MSLEPAVGERETQAGHDRPRRDTFGGKERWREMFGGRWRKVRVEGFIS